MFDELSEKLQSTFDRLAGKGQLTEKDVDIAMREVKIALLEADVNFKVVRDFVKRVKEKAIGAEVLKSLTPAQVVVKIVHDELIDLLGEAGRLDLSGPPPTVIMLVGLQGSGKTTTAGKLANWLRKQGHRPMLVAADTYRPAAVKQLEVLGEQLGIPVHSEGTEPPPPDIAERGVREAKHKAYDVVIIDTAGRLQIDEALMQELEEIKARVNPREILLVADAMTGQEAVNVADTFHKRIGLTGVIFTKVDGDARGGAALSIRAVTGVPIKFLGVGEKLDALEPFHPDRLASRILGMGDVLTLIEKAEQTIDTSKAEKLEKRLRQGEFDLEDFLEQLQQLKKLGPFTQLLELIPGMSGLKNALPADVTERELKKIEAIINSMTREERRNPRIINGSRKRRIAAGSGTTVQDVNELLKQFRMMQKMIKQLSGKGGKRRMRLPFDLPPGFGL
ncbi:signal recognition particle subunit SRP54 [Ardenticatena maritima]|uniref:Signal recognition particle protein n=1 Tax=Ardenticatena maritima TaxID=872965 RepID=A0A0M9UBB6_9CHLR|nr:signal recognition particle protein [Ardenticatena maritima]KPL88562.1 signal recognition particle [Ardenticatena maritima]GAP61698.1 signal recognition particle subunit SRP54 [Ardenticatena maritima]